jgi:hypothetical protein
LAQAISGKSLAASYPFVMEATLAALPLVLEQVWLASKVPAAERRWLANAAVGRAQIAAGGAFRASPGDIMDGLEVILSSMNKLLGCPTPKLTIAAAKRDLRARGEEGHQLAARLGRYSKGRNALAHCDAALMGDIVARIAAGDKTTIGAPVVVGQVLVAKPDALACTSGQQPQLQEPVGFEEPRPRAQQITDQTGDFYIGEPQRMIGVQTSRPRRASVGSQTHEMPGPEAAVPLRPHDLPAQLPVQVDEAGKVDDEDLSKCSARRGKKLGKGAVVRGGAVQKPSGETSSNNLGACTVEGEEYVAEPVFVVVPPVTEPFLPGAEQPEVDCVVEGLPRGSELWSPEEMPAWIDEQKALGWP